MAVTFHGLEQDASWQTSMVMETVGAPEEKGEVIAAEITGKWVSGWTPTAGKLRDEGGGGEAIAKLLQQDHSVIMRDSWDRKPGKVLRDRKGKACVTGPEANNVDSLRKQNTEVNTLNEECWGREGVSWIETHTISDRLLLTGSWFDLHQRLVAGWHVCIWWWWGGERQQPRGADSSW